MSLLQRLAAFVKTAFALPVGTNLLSYSWGEVGMTVGIGIGFALIYGYIFAPLGAPDNIRGLGGLVAITISYLLKATFRFVRALRRTAQSDSEAIYQWQTVEAGHLWMFLLVFLALVWVSHGFLLRQ